MLASFHHDAEWMILLLLSAALLFMEQAVVVTLAQTTTTTTIAPTALGQQCQAGEVLLEFRTTHTPTEGFVDMSIDVQGPRSSSSALGYYWDESPDANNDGEMRESFGYYETIVPPLTTERGSVSMCVPEDQCLTASVKVYASLPYLDYSVERTRYKLSPQEFTFIYNGQIVSPEDIKGPFPYSLDGAQLVAELGTNCTVVCDPEDEVLLELETVLAGVASYDWQIFDYATGELFYGCPPSNMNYTDARCYWSDGQYYHERICLPKDGCFALLAGEAEPQIYIDVDTTHSTVVNVTLDGKQFTKSLFDRTRIEVIPLLRTTGADQQQEDIGATNSSSSSSCPSWSSPCGQEGDDDDASEFQLLEMFIFRNEVYLEDYPEMTWSLTTVDNDNGGEVPLTIEQGNLGMGVIQYGDRPITYHRVCVPRNDSCVRFDLTVPPTDTVFLNTTYDKNGSYSIGSYFESDSYRLVMDGIVYGAEEYQFGWNGYTTTVFEHTQFLGECNVSQICSFEDLLLQVDLVTGSLSPNWYSYNIHWALYNYYMKDDDYQGTPLASSRGNALPDEAHRYFVCFNQQSISDDGSCTAVGVDMYGVNSGNIALYSISVSGTEYRGREYSDLYQSWRDSYIWTPISGDCEEPVLSQGAIIGLSIGGVVVAFCCGVGLYKLYSRRSQPEGEGGGTSSPAPSSEAAPRSVTTTSGTTSAHTGEAIAIPVIVSRRDVVAVPKPTLEEDQERPLEDSPPGLESGSGNNNNNNNNNHNRRPLTGNEEYDDDEEEA